MQPFTGRGRKVCARDRLMKKGNAEDFRHQSLFTAVGEHYCSFSSLLISA